MPIASTSIDIRAVVSLIGFLVVWFVLFECAHVLVTWLRRGPLIGWGISPFGVTVVFLQEPSVFFIWLNLIFPALVSGVVLYVGLFTPLAPLAVPHILLLKIVIIVLGIILASAIDFVNALRDLRYPLWGEARILRSLQSLQSSWATIHFTPFGLSYLRDHFGSSPTDLLQAM